jgi:hypothetical protein
MEEAAILEKKEHFDAGKLTNMADPVSKILLINLF